MLQVDYQNFLSTSLIIIVSNNKLQQVYKFTLNEVVFQALCTRILSLIENKIQELFQDFQEPFQVNSRIEELKNLWK